MQSDDSARSLLIRTTYRVHPEDADTFKDIAERMAKDARLREGNTFLLAAQDISNPGTFHLTEGWKSQRAIDEHLASEGFQGVLTEAQRLRIEYRSATVFEVVHSYELGLPA